MSDIVLFDIPRPSGSEEETATILVLGPTHFSRSSGVQRMTRSTRGSRAAIGSRLQVLTLASGVALVLADGAIVVLALPELVFVLDCCRDRATWPWEQMLKEMLGASDVHVRMFERIALQAGGAAR